MTQHILSYTQKINLKDELDFVKKVAELFNFSFPLDGICKLEEALSAYLHENQAESKGEQVRNF